MYKYINIYIQLIQYIVIRDIESDNVSSCFILLLHACGAYVLYNNRPPVYACVENIVYERRGFYGNR